MFLKSRRSYDRFGSQRAAGPFLMLFSNRVIYPDCARIASGRYAVRALVRYCRMQQCGHFMMGSVVVASRLAQAANETVPIQDRTDRWWKVRDGAYRIGLSGPYGADGLTLEAADWPGLWDQLHPLPDELVEQFWQGGGHNSAGAEGPAVHEWAAQQARQLRQLRRP